LFVEANGETENCVASKAAVVAWSFGEQEPSSVPPLRRYNVCSTRVRCRLSAISRDCRSRLVVPSSAKKRRPNLIRFGRVGRLECAPSKASNCVVSSGNEQRRRRHPTGPTRLGVHRPTAATARGVRSIDSCGKPQCSSFFRRRSSRRSLVIRVPPCRSKQVGRAPPPFDDALAGR